MAPCSETPSGDAGSGDHDRFFHDPLLQLSLPDDVLILDSLADDGSLDVQPIRLPMTDENALDMMLLDDDAPQFPLPTDDHTLSMMLTENNTPFYNPLFSQQIDDDTFIDLLPIDDNSLFLRPPPQLPQALDVMPVVDDLPGGQPFQHPVADAAAPRIPPWLASTETFNPALPPSVPPQDAPCSVWDQPQPSTRPEKRLATIRPRLLPSQPSSAGGILTMTTNPPPKSNAKQANVLAEMVTTFQLEVSRVSNLRDRRTRSTKVCLKCRTLRQKVSLFGCEDNEFLD